MTEMTSQEVDERVAAALELLETHNAHTAQRETWLRVYARKGTEPGQLYGMAHAWATWGQRSRQES